MFRNILVAVYVVAGWVQEVSVADDRHLLANGLVALPKEVWSSTAGHRLPVRRRPSRSSDGRLLASRVRERAEGVAQSAV